MASGFAQPKPFFSPGGSGGGNVNIPAIKKKESPEPAATGFILSGDANGNISVLFHLLKNNDKLVANLLQALESIKKESPHLKDFRIYSAKGEHDWSKEVRIANETNDYVIVLHIDFPDISIGAELERHKGNLKMGLPHVHNAREMRRLLTDYFLNFEKHLNDGLSITD